MEFEEIKNVNEGDGIVEINTKEAQKYYEDHYKQLVTDVEHMELKGDARRKERKMEKILEEVKQERVEIKEKIKKYKQRLREGDKFDLFDWGLEICLEIENLKSPLKRYLFSNFFSIFF